MIRVSRRQLLTLVATILGSTVVFLDSTVVNVALPAIADDLNAGLAGQQWVVEAYMLTLVALLLVGRLARRPARATADVRLRPDRLRRDLDPLRAGARRSSSWSAPAPCRGSPGRCWCPARWRSSPPPSRARPAARRSAPGRPGPGSRPCSARPAAVRWSRRSPGGRSSGSTSRWSRSPCCSPCTRCEESSDPDAFRGIDWLGIGLSAAGLAGPVFALIEQPTHGWGDPLVCGPDGRRHRLLRASSCCTRRAPAHPMLDLALFRIRNFWVANLTTLSAYAGLIGGALLRRVSSCSRSAATRRSRPAWRRRRSR